MRSCRTMRPPYSFFHAQARSRNFSRPMSLLGDALGLEGLDHLDLGGDGGVVRARHPEGRVALHAVVADEHILRHLIQRVAHVELTGDVRRRHDDGEGLLFRVDDRLEGPGRLPLFVDARFHILRRKYLVHLEFLHGLPSVRYKKPVPAKGRGQTAVPPLFAPSRGLFALYGARPGGLLPFARPPRERPSRLGHPSGLAACGPPSLGSLRATPLRHRHTDYTSFAG